MKTPDSRLQEIEKAAENRCKEIYVGECFNSKHPFHLETKDDFIAGAKWADENPVHKMSRKEKAICDEMGHMAFSVLNKETELLHQQLAIAKEALENVQWNGKESYNRTFAKSCPSCKGIFPEDITVNGWIKEAVGHKQDCKLKIALAQISELEK